MWLFLDMNSYFAGVEQQQRPELRGRPVGVVPMLADSTCCIAASYEAKCFGVKTGTNVEEARRLCPKITFVEARPWLYRETHERILEAVERVVPVHEVLSVDEMVVRPWRNERTLADALRLGQEVQDAVRYGVGEWLSCSVGLAPNAFLAKVASDFQKPRGLSVICAEDIPHKLHRLKLTDWPGIAKRMEARFAAHGVTTTAGMYGLTLGGWHRCSGALWGNGVAAARQASPGGALERAGTRWTWRRQAFQRWLSVSFRFLRYPFLPCLVLIPDLRAGGVRSGGEPTGERRAGTGQTDGRRFEIGRRRTLRLAVVRLTGGF